MSKLIVSLHVKQLGGSRYFCEIKTETFDVMLQFLCCRDVLHPTWGCLMNRRKCMHSSTLSSTCGFHLSQSKLPMCVLPIPLEIFGGHGPYVLVHVGFIRFCVRSWPARQQIFRQKRTI